MLLPRESLCDSGTTFIPFHHRDLIVRRVQRPRPFLRTRRPCVRCVLVPTLFSFNNIFQVSATIANVIFTVFVQGTTIKPLLNYLHVRPAAVGFCSLWSNGSPTTNALILRLCLFQDDKEEETGHRLIHELVDTTINHCQHFLHVVAGGL